MRSASRNFTQIPLPDSRVPSLTDAKLPKHPLKVIDRHDEVAPLEQGLAILVVVDAD